jgi:hypothetical protein
MENLVFERESKQNDLATLCTCFKMHIKGLVSNVDQHIKEFVTPFVYDSYVNWN